MNRAPRGPINPQPVPPGRQSPQRDAKLEARRARAEQAHAAKMAKPRPAAYGAGEPLAYLQDDGIEPRVKVQPPSAPGGLFTKGPCQEQDPPGSGRAHGVLAQRARARAGRPCGAHALDSGCENGGRLPGPLVDHGRGAARHARSAQRGTGPPVRLIADVVGRARTAGWHELARIGPPELGAEVQGVGGGVEL
jgi:hypothetical protein